MNTAAISVKDALLSLIPVQHENCLRYLFNS